MPTPEQLPPIDINSKAFGKLRKALREQRKSQESSRQEELRHGIQSLHLPPVSLHEAVKKAKSLVHKADPESAAPIILFPTVNPQEAENKNL